MAAATAHMLPNHPYSKESRSSNIYSHSISIFQSLNHYYFDHLNLNKVALNTCNKIQKTKTANGAIAPPLHKEYTHELLST